MTKFLIRIPQNKFIRIIKLRKTILADRVQRRGGIINAHKIVYENSESK
jgi:hypothetical protein